MRNHWLMGRDISVIPDNDCLVRGVTLILETGNNVTKENLV